MCIDRDKPWVTKRRPYEGHTFAPTISRILLNERITEGYPIQPRYWLILTSANKTLLTIHILKWWFLLGDLL